MSVTAPLSHRLARSPSPRYFMLMRTPKRIRKPRNYDGWRQQKPKLLSLVNMLLDAHPATQLTWRKEKDRHRKITPTDLAATLYAIQVATNDNSTLSYLQLSYAHQSIVGMGCPRNKASTILSILLGLDAISKIGGHSKGKHGTRYNLSPTLKGMMSEQQIADLTEALSRKQGG